MKRPSIKALLLQMKLDPNYEMRVLAEETVLNEFEDLQKERDELEVHYKDCCQEYQDADESLFNLKKTAAKLSSDVDNLLQERAQLTLERQILLEALEKLKLYGVQSKLIEETLNKIKVK